jgi:hypothetical protein
MKNIPGHFKNDSGKFDPLLFYQSIETNNFDTVAEYDGVEGAELRLDRGWLAPDASQVEFYFEMWEIENWKKKDVEKVVNIMKG